MRAGKAPTGRPRRKRDGQPRGSILIFTLLAVLVLFTLGLTLLTLSFSEEVNARRDRSRLLAFYAGEGGVHEAVVRMNLDPSGPSNDEIELKWGAGNPASVRDPRMVQGNKPEPDPNNFSDSSVNSWRFWNYDPAWRYAGTSTEGEGNYPGATPAQQANLDSAGRVFTLDATSARTLVTGATYSVRVVPHIRNIAGTGWTFVDERGTAALANYYYYKVTGTGTQGAQMSTAEVLVKKFHFGPSIPAALTAGGNVVVGGNATVTMGDLGDTNPTGVAVQSAGTVSTTGSGTTAGTELNSTAFPGFQPSFGISPADLQPQATITASYTANTTTNPSQVPSGTVGQVIWLTAKDTYGVKKEINFTGTGAGGYILGSPTQPVILVVDGTLTLNSVTIYGVVYVTGAFRNQGGSQIHGAILVEGTAETDILGTGGGSGGTKIAYSASVLRELNNFNVFPFRFVHGSWRLHRG